MFMCVTDRYGGLHGHVTVSVGVFLQLNPFDRGSSWLSHQSSELHGELDVDKINYILS